MSEGTCVDCAYFRFEGADRPADALANAKRRYGPCACNSAECAQLGVAVGSWDRCERWTASEAGSGA